MIVSRINEITSDQGRLTQGKYTILNVLIIIIHIKSIIDYLKVI